MILLKHINTNLSSDYHVTLSTEGFSPHKCLGTHLHGRQESQWSQYNNGSYEILRTNTVVG